MLLKSSDSAKKAVKLGTLCSVSYLAVYIVRNILSALSPKMLKDGFTTESIGSLSSAFFITYAIGQLINGIMGDIINDILGTNIPSITSTCTYSAPPWLMRPRSLSRFAKSDERIDGDNTIIFPTPFYP